MNDHEANKEAVVKALLATNHVVQGRHSDIRELLGLKEIMSVTRLRRALGDLTFVERRIVRQRPGRARGEHSLGDGVYRYYLLPN